MQVWKRIAVTTLLSGLTTLPTFGTDFEPLSIPEIARRLGVGFGPGYHARPCNQLRAMYYDCVTNGATPFGQSDLSLLSYDHTHPNFAWRYPVNGQCGCDACRVKQGRPAETLPSPKAVDDQDASKEESSADDDSGTSAGNERLTPPTQSFGQRPYDPEATDDEVNFLTPTTPSETVISPSPSDESGYVVPTFQTSSRRPAARLHSIPPQRSNPQSRMSPSPNHPDPVWLRNMGTQPALPAPVRGGQSLPLPPPMMSGLPRFQAPPRGYSKPTRPARTANRPVDFLWH